MLFCDKCAIFVTKMENVERITPYSSSGDKTNQVRDMFDSIAPAYDLMNRLMSFGLHRRWLRKAVAMATAAGPSSVLDVATGTADVAIALAKSGKGVKVTGVDLSSRMIEVGRQKVAEEGLNDSVSLCEGDCMSLSFDDMTFDGVTVAYGVRNFEHLFEGYAEMLRVLKPGGTVTVIELSVPRSRLVRPFYKLYTGCVIPLIGRMISRDVRAYSYLPESIAAVPQGEEMRSLMERAGFVDVTVRPLTLGTCTIYHGRRPV